MKSLSGEVDELALLMSVTIVSNALLCFLSSKRLRDLENLHRQLISKLEDQVASQKHKHELLLQERADLMSLVEDLNDEVTEFLQSKYSLLTVDHTDESYGIIVRNRAGLAA